MNIANLFNDLKARLYLTKFRINHNDYFLKLKINFGLILLTSVIILPITYIGVSTYFLNEKNNITESNALKELSTYDVLVTPLNGQITSAYGYRNDPISGNYSKHTGIDISGIHHDNIKNIANGIVTFSGTQNGFGNCIEIKHNIDGKDIYSFYAHLSKILVNTNDYVTAGQIIGTEGGDPRTDPNPGYSTGHHLHFEIRTNSGYGNDIDPTKYLYNS